MDTFDKLSWATLIAHDRFPFLALVGEWGDKRQHVAMYQRDIPGLVRAFVERNECVHKSDLRCKEVDPVPGLRLASACEGLANCVYSTCDIAASFANKASDGRIQSSFNRIVKKVRRGSLPVPLFDQDDSLDWYAGIRELRTEWTHHSTVFIGEGDDGPVVAVKPLRRLSDRVVFPEKTLLSVQDLTDWSSRAVHVVDRFGLQVFMKFVLPKLDLGARVFEPDRDEDGFLVLAGNGLAGRQVTVLEYLRHGGISV